METDPQTIRLSTSALGPEASLQGFKASLPQYQIDLNGASPRDFSIEMSAWLVDSMILGGGSLSPLRIVRAPFQRFDGYDQLLVTHCIRGSWHGEAEGRPIFAGPGETICIDTQRPFRLINNFSHHQFMLVPRDKIPQTFLRNPGLHGFVLRGVNNFLLSAHLNALLDYLPRLSRAEALRLKPAILSLLAAALGEAEQVRLPAAELGSAQPALRLRVERYIECNLASPDLVPDAISRDLGIPRSSLYRAFSALGGISGYIRTRRLDAACALLTHPEEHRSVREIAETLGFDCATTFSNAFRRRFGCSPREARGRKAIEAGDTRTMFDRWHKATHSGDSPPPPGPSMRKNYPVTARYGCA